MKILYLDTSSSFLYCGLVDDDKIIFEIKKNYGRDLSKYTLYDIEYQFKINSVSPKSVDKIILVNGPGSFTGVRIGVTIAKTYGYLINKEIIPVSSLKALAISSNKNNDNVMSVITANRSSYYVGIYDSEYNNIIDEEFVSRDKLLELIDKYNPYIVSNDFNVIGIHKLNKVNLDVLRIVDYYKDMDKVNYHALVPNYLKLPQAMENR